ncbi:MAG TPA: hypothetical protein VFT12_07980 [Thermoanaerobaculia bacterium]|nr:hypothetical protein [Thermoanaerobaculia bacterium]
MRVEIQSRPGNVIVGLLGVVYSATGLVLFVIHFMQTWGAASLAERAVQMLLIAVIAVSAWFVSIAAHGLKLHVPLRRTAPATAS